MPKTEILLERVSEVISIGLGGNPFLSLIVSTDSYSDNFYL